MATQWHLRDYQLNLRTTSQPSNRPTDQPTNRAPFDNFLPSHFPLHGPVRCAVSGTCHTGAEPISHRNTGPNGSGIRQQLCAAYFQALRFISISLALTGSRDGLSVETLPRTPGHHGRDCE
ncbi:putative effector protein [Anopheles sinensis]|uniref:Putative effector protein n=1 Tax=Anopheles sinensis TaxID=74873 RepID=A0A084VUX2_ANOSI|nr:putative effector protein [Anopheles sinensis]